MYAPRGKASRPHTNDGGTGRKPKDVKHGRSISSRPPDYARLIGQFIKTTYTRRDGHLD